ncbi:hypothetical protein B0H13DRAFT_2662519 [Mycena leptocephala]|nr:hypothetical protein B0H13DRAFT_2662519 [Mycena leptocephala]
MLARLRPRPPNRARPLPTTPSLCTLHDPASEPREEVLADVTITRRHSSDFPPLLYISACSASNVTYKPVSLSFAYPFKSSSTSASSAAVPPPSEPPFASSVSGLVVGLDYKNPWVEPYREFQRMKNHPHFRALLSNGGAERLAYGARTLTEGGLQSLPRCSAGVVNTAKIKGTHNAMRTGMLAAEAAFSALHPSASFVSTASPETFKVTPTKVEEGEGEGSASADAPLSLTAYTTSFRNSPAYNDLWAVRNVWPAFNTRLGGAVDVEASCPWGEWEQPLHLVARRARDAPRPACKPIEYPLFEPPLSTDLMSSVALTGTNHSEGEAVHLRTMRGVGGLSLALSTLHAPFFSVFYLKVLIFLVSADGEKGEKEEEEDADADGEAEGWEGTKLVINSQTAELHPLQIVRYQGPDAGYYVDCARGWGWAEV